MPRCRAARDHGRRRSSRTHRARALHLRRQAQLRRARRSRRGWRRSALQTARRLIAEMVPATTSPSRRPGERFWAEREALVLRPPPAAAARQPIAATKPTSVSSRNPAGRLHRAGAGAAVRTMPSRSPASRSSSKFLDLRNYALFRQGPLVVARLYQGQTTNFTTPGGGFARRCSKCRGPLPPVKCRHGFPVSPVSPVPGRRR